MSHVPAPYADMLRVHGMCDLVRVRTTHVYNGCRV